MGPDIGYFIYIHYAIMNSLTFPTPSFLSIITKNEMNVIATWK